MEHIENATSKRLYNIIVVSYQNRPIRRKCLVIISISFLLLLFLHILGLEFNKAEGQSAGLCVNTKLSVDLPSADGLVMDKNIPASHWKYFTNNSTDRRIFFHETSGRSELNIKQCCVIESAARNNPDRPIQLFLRPSSACINASSFHSPPWLQVLSELPNVDCVLVNEAHYFARTPLESWYSRGEWRRSKYQTAHLADYIRILTLNKGGGLYLDLDILVLNALNATKFRNCLAYEDAFKNVIGNSVMHMERGFWLAAEIMQLISSDYDPQGYGYHGPAAIGEVMRRHCGVVEGKRKPKKCADINILPSRYFYPIPSFISQIIFRDNGNQTDLETLAKMKGSYGLHLWNSLSDIRQPIDLKSNQVFSILARQHCPSTVARAADFPTLANMMNR